MPMVTNAVHETRELLPSASRVVRIASCHSWTQEVVVGRQRNTARRGKPQILLVTIARDRWHSVESCMAGSVRSSHPALLCGVPLLCLPPFTPRTLCLAQSVPCRGSHRRAWWRGGESLTMTDELRCVTGRAGFSAISRTHDDLDARQCAAAKNK